MSTIGPIPPKLVYAIPVWMDSKMYTLHVAALPQNLPQIAPQDVFHELEKPGPKDWSPRGRAGIPRGVR